MSNLWINIRFWKNWFLQIGPDWPWVVVARNQDAEYKTKFAIYQFFGWNSFYD